MFGGFSEKWKHIEIDIVVILLLAKPGAVDESDKFSQLVSGSEDWEVRWENSPLWNRALWQRTEGSICHGVIAQ